MTANAHDREVLDFLVEFTLDQQAGRTRALGEYLAHYPGREEAVAREFLRLEDQAATTTPETGTTIIGPFELLTELGRGAQGTVWRARDRRLGREVALKILHRDGRRLGGQQRLEREALLAARLDHPSLATVFAVGEHAGCAWLAMRYVPGESLAAILANERATMDRQGRCVRLPHLLEAAREREAIHAIVRFFAHAARALEVAHSRGIVHRDVKPGNLMVDPDGKPVLVDFGLARDHESSAACLTGTGEQLGTPAYMAPEQLAPGAGSPGPTADIWGLAVVMFEALTGVHPFGAATREAILATIRDCDPPALRHLNPAVPRGLATVLHVALQKDPRRRHRSIAAFADDLELVAAGEPPTCRPPGAARRLASWSRKHPVLSVTATLALVFAGSVIAIQNHAFRIEARLRQRVSARVDDLRGLSRGLLTASHDVLRDLPGAIEANRDLAKLALDYLEILRAEAADDPALVADVVRARLHVGDILGSPRAPNLGDRDAARHHFESALALLNATAGGVIENPEQLRAATLLRLADLEASEHRPTLARTHWQEALDLLEDAPANQERTWLAATLHLRLGESTLWSPAGEDPQATASAALETALVELRQHATENRFALLAATIEAAVAQLRAAAGDDERATTAARAAAARVDALPPGWHARLSVRTLRAVLTSTRGGLQWRAGEAADAITDLEAADGELTDLARHDPGNEQVARHRLQNLATLSLVLLDQERQTDCEPILQRARQLVEEGAQRFGADWFEEQRAITLTRLGQLRYDQLDYPAAIELMRGVVDTHRDRAARFPEDVHIAGQLALAELRLGWSLVRSQQPGDGRATIDSARAALTELLQRDPSVLAWRKGLVASCHQLGELAFGSQDFASAVEHFSAAIREQRRLPSGAQTDRALAILYQGLAESTLQTRDVTTAGRHAATAVEILRELVRQNPQDRYFARLLATALVDRSRLHVLAKEPQAAATVDEALRIVTPLQRPDHTDNPKVLQTHAMAHVMRAVLADREDDRAGTLAALRAARTIMNELPTDRRRLPFKYSAIQKQLERKSGFVESSR
ncbi:MAG: serine/threonine protein kinase [bacterium]|nr:serine/threonine protein kinase [bacterium]